MLILAASGPEIELRSCIVPVTKLTGCGTGSKSRKALAKLKAFVSSCWDVDTEVWLEIVN